ncbi:MAG: hypothetical protein AAFW00_21440 [Bacteroidota bacterium]
MTLHKSILLILIVAFTSCSANLEECQCTEIMLSAISFSADFSSRNSEKSERKSADKMRITDKEVIEEIKNSFHRLDKLEGKYDGIDVRVVVDFKCENMPNQTVLVSDLFIQKGDDYFSPDPKFIDLLKGEMYEDVWLTGKVTNIQNYEIQDLKNVACQEFTFLDAKPPIRTETRTSYEFTTCAWSYLLNENELLNVNDSIWVKVQSFVKSSDNKIYISEYGKITK